MTLRSVIFFSFVCNLGPATSSLAWCATVSGRVELTDSNAPSSRESDHAGVVVWLAPLSGVPPDSPLLTVTVAHKKKTFVPHVVAIRIGSKVSFPNQDPFFHNAFSNYEGETFDIGLHPPGSSREHTFHRPGVVRLFCNIHPTMSAVIVVLNSPFFAVSNPNGAFAIPAVPAGEYSMELFHERSLPDTLTALKRRVTIEATDITLPPISISQAGYLAPPHKNKYGKDYPPVIVDSYPGPDRKR